MKKCVLIILMLGLMGYLVGCGKKQQVQELPEPMSIEQLSTFDTETEVISQTPLLEPLPPAGPYKPQAKEIQTALKNAGFYMWAIDGKIGPMTKKAIEEFQKANDLKVDGIVGPKTWDKLETYLNPSTLEK